MATRDVKITLSLIPSTLNSGVLQGLRRQMDSVLGRGGNSLSRLLNTSGLERDAARSQQRLLEAEKRGTEQRLTIARRAAESRLTIEKRLQSDLEKLQARATLGFNQPRSGGGLSLRGIAAGVGIGVGVSEVKDFIGGSVQAAVQLEGLKQALITITGSASAASVQLARLRELAKLPGLGFEEAIRGSVNLQQVGFSATQAERALKEFSNAVALTGGGKDDLAGVLVQLVQMSTETKVLARDLQPIIQRAPVLGKVLKEAFGTVSSEQISKQVKGFDEFFEKVLNGLSKLERAPDSPRNTIDNLTDAYTRFQAGLGQGLIEKGLPALRNLTAALEENEGQATRLGRSFAAFLEQAFVNFSRTTGGAITLSSVLGLLDSGFTKAARGLAAVRDVGELAFASLRFAVNSTVASISEQLIGVLDLVGLRFQSLNKIFADSLSGANAAQQRFFQGFSNTAAFDSSVNAGLKADFDRRLEEFYATINGGQQKDKPTDLAALLAKLLKEKGKVRTTGGGGGAKLSDLARDLQQADELTRKLAKLENTSSAEFKIAERLKSLREFERNLEKVLELSKETGRAVQLPNALRQVFETLDQNKSAFGDAAGRAKAIEVAFQSDAKAAKDLTVRLSALKAIAEQVHKNREIRFEFEAPNLDVIQEQLEKLKKTTDDLDDELEKARSSFRELLESFEPEATTNLERVRRRLQTDLKSLPKSDADKLLSAASQSDARDLFEQQTQQAKETAERVRGFFLDAFRAAEQQGLRGFWDTFVQLGRSALNRIIAEILTKLTLNIGAKLFGGQGQGGGIFSGIFGGGGQSGGGLLGGIFGGQGGAAQRGGVLGSIFGGGGLLGGGFPVGTGGFGGGTFGGSIFGTQGSGIGSFFNFGNLFGGGSKAAGNSLGGGLANVASSPFASLGAGGLLAGGGILGSLLGGKSPVGRLLGGAGGALGLGALGATGIFGSGLAGALPALFSNPITAVVAGALLGGAALFNVFSNRDLKRLRRAIKETYSVDIKDNPVLKQIKEIGKQNFGKKWEQRRADVLRLEEVKEIISGYAESTGQQARGLTLQRQFADPNFSGNQFVRRELGGRILPGIPYLVGERRPEVIIPDRAATVQPSVNGSNSAMLRMVAVFIEKIAALENKISSMRPGDVVTAGLNQNPRAATNAVSRVQRADTQYSANFARQGGYF